LRGDRSTYPHIFNEFYLEYKLIHETTTSYYPETNGKTKTKKLEHLLN